MKDLRSEKELLVQQKSAQYETYQYFRDYHRELQTVCENVNHILDASQTKQQEQKNHISRNTPYKEISALVFQTKAEFLFTVPSLCH